MKIFNRFTYALMALSLLAVSCQEEEIFKPGEEEDANCYGVFFPTQDASGFHEADPADEPVCTVKVSRTNTNDAITVPLTATADTTGIFVVPESVSFEAGQADTSFVINYAAAESGKAYSLSVQILDSKYASKYSSNAAFLDFSVQKVKWNSLGTIKYTDYINPGIFSAPNFVFDVEVQERDDMKGMYRLIEPYKTYSETINAWCYDEYGEIWSSSDSYTPTNIIINATDPNAVYIKAGSIGYSHDPGYGEVYCGSKYSVYVDELGFTPEEASAKGVIANGTMVNGVISFPEKEVCVWMPVYDDVSNGWWYASSAFKILLPGAIDVDYSLSMSSSEVDDEGVVVVDITSGADIDSVRYAVYTGTLTNAQYGDVVSALAKGEGVDGTVKCVDGGATINVTADTTAQLTLVAVGLDTAGVKQANDRVEFGYVKKGDEVPVVVSLNASAIKNYTNDTELAYTVFGQKITDVKVIAISQAEYTTWQNALDALMETESLTAEQIAAVNTTGYTGIIDKLLPGTFYYVLAYAFNGYKSTVVYTEAYTSGEPKKIYSSWDEVDTLLTTIDSSMVTKYYGTWNYYAKRSGTLDDGKVSDGLRQYIGQVTIEDAPGLPTVPDTSNVGAYYDYVQVIGSMGPFAEYWGVSDTLIFVVYEGYMYNLSNKLGNAYGYYIASGVKIANYGPQAWSYAMFGAFVEEGYVAFFDNDTGYNATGFAYAVYGDDAYSDYKGNGGIMYDPIFVNPAIDEENHSAPSVKGSENKAKARIVEASKACPFNYVETREGHMKSIIDRANASKIKVNTTSRDANGVYVPATSAKGVHTEAVSGVNASKRTFSKEIKLDAKVSRK